MGNARNIAFWVVLFMLILALFQDVQRRPDHQLPRARCLIRNSLQRVEAGEVSSVTLDGERVLVQAKDGTRYVHHHARWRER